VMSYGVARRVREIGIRMALGATRRMVLWQILRTTLALSAAGVVIGVATTLPAARLISSFLFGVTDRDLTTLLASAIVLMSVSLVAGYVPARRAAHVDPMDALRLQ
jgi:putative ABC transport system permease protein